ncbi:S-layer homology domain-containing protein [Tumebacillus sp. DT12]|uniref:S-layer homology domain-containing protein n=1 Tax=Tumebacillus lacus TaxID=2995335 RepID=A0ABT3X2K4_9BACL|nr:S-layer homology domain-containing protein [Tumebacillus lacus]MCX7571142.1 S-layer homology domain-containing protein [Tumebacillus lacus]
MKVSKRLKAAGAWILSLSMVFGSTPLGAKASSEQIYSWPTILSKTATDPIIVTKGVTYQRFNFQTSSGPIVIHETWTQLDDPNVEVKAVLSHDKLENEKNETVSEMARRTGAVAGTNGDFFESQGSGMALGMGVENGKLIHSPSPSAVLGIDYTNRIVMGHYTLTAQMTANGQTSAITSVNGHPVTFPNGMVLLTPELGFWEMAANATVVTLEPVSGDAYKVIGIQPAQTVVEAPVKPYLKVLAQGVDAINYVTANVKKDDTIKLGWGTNPSSSHLKYAIGGGPILLKGGSSYKDPNPPLKGVENTRMPLTGVGVTADGKRMMQVVVDGRSKESIGLTYGQMANYFAHRNLSDAMLFDGGGSSDMVIRDVGDTQAKVISKPSDGWERRVANGLFVYSTSPSGQPTHVHVNDGQNVTVFKGRSVTLAAPAIRDQNYNPLPSAPVTYTVEPATLGTITANGVFTAGVNGGAGKIIATTANGAKGEVAVNVITTVDSLTISPASAMIGNDESVTFTVKGNVLGQSFTLDPADLNWTADRAFGTVEGNGRFTAVSGDKTGRTTVTASFGGKSVGATVDIGYVRHTLDQLTDAGKWTRTDRWGDVGTLTTSTTAQIGDKTQFLTMNYRFAAGSGLKQFVFYPKETMSIPHPTDKAAVDPIGIGMWVYGNNSGVRLFANFEKPDGTFVRSTDTAAVTWSGWKFVSFKIPAGTPFPVKLDYLDAYVDSPTAEVKGTLYFSDLQVLFNPTTYKEKEVVVPQPTVVTFPDIANHWGRTVVETLATKGIINGRDKDHFDPDAGLSRAEAVTLIVRSLNLPSDTGTTFSDVPSDAWYASTVSAAVKAGITNGVGDGKFAPHEPVNRNQMAKMIYHALKTQGKAPTGGTPLAFKDADLIASWAKAEIDALSAAGLMVGDGTGYLRPVKTATRVESAYMIHNMLKYAGLLS